MSMDLAPFELPQETALAVFTDGGRYSDFYTKLKAETDKLVPDLTTKAGRDEIKSTAFKVVKVKTALAAQALALTEDWRTKTTAVNKSKTKMVDELDALAKSIRKPLTDWEDAEARRLAECREMIDKLQAAAIVTLDDTSEAVLARWNAIKAMDLQPEKFGDMIDEGVGARERALGTLATAATRIAKEESDRAELKRLQEAEATRQREQREKEAAEQAARDAAERDRLAAEQAEQAKKDEEARVEKAKQDAAAEADRAAKEKADAEAREVERKHQEELAAERARADKLAAEEAERQRAEKAEKDAAAAREADVAHRTSVKTAVKLAIMTCGADEDTARKIVMAMLASEIPNVTLVF